jgi:peptidoglycan/LPS O-acetylase OafA/YrhL
MDEDVHTAARRLRAPTLAGAFDPRANSLGLLRLLLAGVVAVAHATDHTGRQPVLGNSLLGDLAVDGFFVISGFLVARSWLRLRSFPRFAWHRFLRIMPGYWICLLVIALVAAPAMAALLGDPAGSVFTGDESAWRYVTTNAALVIRQTGIAGLADDHGPLTMDGSLWTLLYEAGCYGLVAVLGAASLLSRTRRWSVPVVCGLSWLLIVLDDVGVISDRTPFFRTGLLMRFVLVFGLGVVACLYADRVPIRGRWAWVAAVVVVPSTWLTDYRPVGAVAFAYLVVFAVVRLPAWTPPWDLSYGLYVYHWPTQVVLRLAGLTAVGLWPFAALSTLAALVLAAASWKLVEEPALRLKDLRLPVLRERRVR